MEFVSKTVGLIKWKCKQSFKCTKCDDRYPTQGALNKHYQEKHNKVKCPHCPMTFSTTCTLTCHMYVHESTTKKCCCGKTFRFDSELKVHKLTYHCLPTQHCAHPNCGKSYFSASDFTKHAKTHMNVTASCQHCAYETKDERLLKSHQRKHDRTICYICQKCGKRFIYHTQCSGIRMTENVLKYNCVIYYHTL